MRCAIIGAWNMVSMGTEGGDWGQAPAARRSRNEDRGAFLWDLGKTKRRSGWGLAKASLGWKCSFVAVGFECLAFVRSGNVNVNDGKVYNVGERGYDWARTSQSSTNAYNLWMTPTDVNPSNSNNRWIGIPLRWGFGRLRCRSSRWWKV